MTYFILEGIILIGLDRIISQCIVIKYLITWFYSKNRLPLVLHGARQVGETWSIRELASQTDSKLVELNFERNPDLDILFDTNDIKQTVL